MVTHTAITLSKYLSFVCLLMQFLRSTQVVADNELGGLIGALNGEYITPGPGGDPIRNPDVLPTGKNMHALDPQSIPTKAAVDCAAVVVDRLLERLSADAGGSYPETVAFTLWGTDNIKTYGGLSFPGVGGGDCCGMVEEWCGW